MTLICKESKETQEIRVLTLIQTQLSTTSLLTGAHKIGNKIEIWLLFNLNHIRKCFLV